MSIEKRLAELKIQLPKAPKPVASYVPAVTAGGLVYISGQLPLVDGKLTYAGKVGQDLTPEEGKEAAKTCILNCLAVLKEEVGDLERVQRMVRVGVFVNSALGFVGQPQVANGASDLLVEIFGEKGKHARAAVGVNELPLNAAVEVELIAAILPQ